MPVTTQHRDRIKEINERLTGLRRDRTTAKAAVDAAREAHEATAEAVAQGRMEQASYDIEVNEELQRQLMTQMAGVGPDLMGASFADDPQVVSQLERLASSNQPFADLDLGYVASAEQIVATLNSGAWGLPKMATDVPGIVPDTVVGRRGTFDAAGFVGQPRRPLSLLDLIPTSPATGNTVPTLTESGSFDTALETGEGALKPQADVDLADQEVPVRTIAHWVKAYRQILADLPELETIIRQRLTYGVYRRLETQILTGDGTGQNLTGILNTSGVADIAYASGTPLADLSLEALVAVLNSQGYPDACVMNATTLASLLTPKASGSGQYLNVSSPFGVGLGGLSLWGIPIVISPLMANAKVLFGNFGQGARIWVREGVNVTAGLDSDDFTRNKLTLLGEGRFALTVSIPAYFALVNLASS